jgi:hypothetical protein
VKAIVTRYHGPTDRRGSRIAADDGDGNRIVVSYDHALDGEENHRMAAEALKSKMGWTGKLIGGTIRTGMVWVFSGRENRS